jgi:hypothetical protein
MKERSFEAGRGLGKVRQTLVRWRSAHGGRGRPIPAALWEEAVAVARIEGVEVTARALRLDRARLASRVEQCAQAAGSDGSSGVPFVELDASGVCAAGQTVVRLVGRDGECLEVALSAAGVVDVTGLARAFWSRSR